MVDIVRRSAKYIKTLSESVTTNTKTIVFDKPVEINMIHVVYTSDATVGNRQLIMSILDNNDNLIMDNHIGATQAASLVRHYLAMKGIFRETTFIDGELQVPWPVDFVIPRGWKLRIADSAGISASDSFDLDYQYELLADSR